MNFFLSFIAIISFFTISVSAQDYTCIYLNIGDSIQTKITNVQSWGINTSDGRSINHNVISHVITNDQELISKYKQHFTKLLVNKNDEFYTLKIPKDSLIINPILDRKVLAKFYAKVLYMFNEDELFELQFNIHPKFSEKVFFQMTSSIDWNDEKAYLNIVSIGLGYQFDIDPVKVLFLMNYADKVFFNTTSSKIFNNDSFIFPSIYSVFGYEEFKFILGSRYYIDYLHEGKLTFQLGAGITF